MCKWRKSVKEPTYKLVWRPMRVIMYLLLVAMDIFMLLYLGNYFWCILLVLLVMMAILSVAGILMMRTTLTLELGAGWSRSDAGEVAPLEIRIGNPKWYPVLDSRIQFRIANTFYENESNVTVSMPIRMHGTSFLRVPLEFEDLGRFQISVDGCVFQDILGLVTCRWNVVRECEFFILPVAHETEQISTEEYLAGAAETEESKEKGNDFSEVSDIREYIPGDRIRDIHWKLSAKQDMLMVKERVAVAGSEMVILIHLSEDKRESEQILKTVYSLGKNMIDNRMPVCLLCWNENMFQFDEYRCGTMEEVGDAFCDLYRIPVSGHLGDNQNAYIKNCFPFLKTYLSVYREDGDVQVEMRENV